MKVIRMHGIIAYPANLEPALSSSLSSQKPGMWIWEIVKWELERRAREGEWGEWDGDRWMDHGDGMGMRGVVDCE